MRLKPIRSSPSVKLAGRIPGELHGDLIAYAEYYREVVSAPIATWPLVVQMLRTFIESDRGFQAWRRQHRNGGAARPDAAPNKMQANG